MAAIFAISVVAPEVRSRALAASASPDVAWGSWSCASHRETDAQSAKLGPNLSGWPEGPKQLTARRAARLVTGGPIGSSAIAGRFMSSHEYDDPETVGSIRARLKVWLSARHPSGSVSWKRETTVGRRS